MGAGAVGIEFALHTYVVRAVKRGVVIPTVGRCTRAALVGGGVAFTHSRSQQTRNTYRSTYP